MGYLSAVECRIHILKTVIPIKIKGGRTNE